MKKAAITGLLLAVFLIGASVIYTNALTSPVAINEGMLSAGYDQSGNMYIESDHLQVKFDGTTPHVAFYYKNNDSVMATYYKLMFSWLNETDVNSTVVKYYKLDQATWNHTDIVNIADANGNSGLNVNFTTTMNILTSNGVVEVPMEIEVYMYETTQILPVGNTTVEVPAGSFKYSVSIGAWPFESTDNSLVFGVKLISNTDAAFYRNQDTGEVTGNTTDGIRMEISNPEIAVEDSVNVEIMSDLKQYGGITFLTYEFPAYNASLYYDPVVDLGTEQDADGTTTQDIEMKGGNTRIVFEGGTPHVKFYFDDGSTNFTTYYKIMFSSLNETTQDGDIVKFWRLETAQWNHTEVLELTIDNSTVYNVNFTTTIDLFVGNPAVEYQIPMKINVYFFLGNATIEYANKSIDVTTGTFKYSVEMGAWPFESTNNTLQLEVEIISNVKARMEYDSKTGKFTAESDEGLSMLINNEDIAILDEQATNISTSYIASGTRTFISYEFPYFNQSMFYDPTISLSASTESTTSTTTSTSSETSESSESETTTGALPGMTWLASFLALLVVPVAKVIKKQR